MAKLKVYVKNNQTEVKVPVGIRLLIRRCCQAVLATEGFGKDAEVSVSFVSNNEIKNLNKIYRNKDSVTDVLSFPLTELLRSIRKQERFCWEISLFPSRLPLNRLQTSVIPLRERSVSLPFTQCSTCWDTTMRQASSTSA